MNTTIILLILAYFILCVGIGNFGNSKGWSFAVGFFVSLLLSPILGIIVIAMIHKKDPATKGNTYIVISDKIKTIMIRSLAIITISYGILIDIVIPSQKSDPIVVLKKHEINQPKIAVGRGVIEILSLFSHYSISGKGLFNSSGYVSQGFYRTVHIDDTLKVYFCPLSMKWKYVELIKSGVVVLSEIPNEVPSTLVFSIFFLIPIIAFKSTSWWWDKPLVWIVIWMSICLGIFSWVELLFHITSPIAF
jgi:hypothetical protein